MYDFKHKGGNAMYTPIYTFNGGIADVVVFVAIGMLGYVVLTTYECFKEKKGKAL